MGVLDGTRVVDFGRYIAGPYCAALLGDLGAEVIRVERIEGGEDRWITPVTSDGVGAMYLQCNRGKRGMTLDLVKPEGREVAQRLRRGKRGSAGEMPKCSRHRQRGVRWGQLQDFIPTMEPNEHKDRSRHVNLGHGHFVEHGTDVSS